MLTLRAGGLSFAAIASRLGLRRSRDAFEAYLRALHSSAESARPDLIRRELERLNTLEARIRSRDAAEPEKMERRLAALARMRERIAGSPGN